MNTGCLGKSSELSLHHGARERIGATGLGADWIGVSIFIEWSHGVFSEWSQVIFR